MIRSIRRAVTLGTVVAATVLGAQAASATAFTFNFAGAQSGPVTPSDSLPFTGCASGAKSCTGSNSLGLDVYGLHLNSSGTKGGSNVSKAAVEAYKGAGLGVLFGTDKETNGTHQIDNYGGGSDFVALVFSQAVTLSDIARVSYTNASSLAGLGSGTDISYRSWAYDASMLWNGTTQVDLAKFASLNGGSNSTGATAASNIWLVAANVTGQTNDAFKLTSLVVNTPMGSVPEPASWALMIVGFGAVGQSLRRRRSNTLVNA